MNTAILQAIKCGACGHIASQYTNFVGDTYLLPQELPLDVLRRASSTAQCAMCKKAMALFELGVAQ
jgi:hypothetical protein